jgi:hypothetical protein
VAPLTFDYTQVSLAATEAFPEGQSVYRPLLRARLVSPSTGAFFKCLVLADTGADHCLFPLSFAAPLGFDPLNMKMATSGGVGNAGNVAYYGDVRIELPIKSGLTLAFSTRAGFTAGLEAVGFGLLGQAGFFEAFRTTFDHRARTFTIEAAES